MLACTRLRQFCLATALLRSLRFKYSGDTHPTYSLCTSQLLHIRVKPCLGRYPDTCHACVFCHSCVGRNPDTCHACVFCHSCVGRNPDTCHACVGRYPVIFFNQKIFELIFYFFYSIQLLIRI